jgi:hypothetical protein
MLNLLFWNVKQGSAESYLAGICLENAIDLLILAEDISSEGRVPSLLNANSLGVPFQELTAPAPTYIRFYSRFPTGVLQRVSDPDRRMAVCAYNPVGGLPLLIAAAHLPSKLHAGEREQHHYARRLRAAIEEAESVHAHNNSVVIGDFNMNPFELGMSAFDGLHGMMDKATASNETRTFAGEASSFFYNPMWSLLGDESPGPPGTYYYNNGGVLNYYWNVFDQVLIRPKIIPYYQNGKLQVVTNIGTTSLMVGNKIDTRISDHLPIMLILKTGDKSQ